MTRCSLPPQSRYVVISPPTTSLPPWGRGIFKYIKVPSMKDNFPQITVVLDKCTSPPVIVDLAGNASPDWHTAGGTARGKDKLPSVYTTVHGMDQAWEFSPASKSTTAPPLQGMGSPQELLQQDKTPHSSAPA